MRMLAALALLLAAPRPPLASEVPAVIGQPVIDDTFEFARRYRQTRYQLEDLQGDVSLMAFFDHVPSVLKAVLFGAPPPADGQPHDPDLNPVLEPAPAEPPDIKPVIDGRKNPLLVAPATRMLAQIMAEELRRGIVPRFGTPHRWSPDFRRRFEENSYRHRIAVGSKVLAALMCGMTWRFLVTGREKNLLAFILSREDGSVTIHELFRQSYRLNEGDVYLTLLTIENVLCEYWRAPGRERRATTLKLAPITNAYNGGDKFGAWYHLFGIMLHAYADGDVARLTAMVEAEGSGILSGRRQKQKAWLNNRGAALGLALREVIWRREYEDFPLGGVDYADPKVYLDLTEDFRDRLPLAESKDLAVSLDGAVLTVQSAERDYLGCRLDVIPDLGQGFDSERLASFPGLPFARGVAMPVRLPFDPPPRAVRAFLEGCSGGARAAKSAVNARLAPDPS